MHPARRIGGVVTALAKFFGFGSAGGLDIAAK